MNKEIYFAAAIGAALPSFIRFFHWLTSAQAQAAFKISSRWWIVLITLVVQVILGLIAVWLLPPPDRLTAAAYGYGAPDVISRVLTSIASKVEAPSTKSALGLSQLQATIRWLRL